MQSIKNLMNKGDASIETSISPHSFSGENSEKKPNYGRLLYICFLVVIIFTVTAMPVYASGTTVWTKANEIMKDVYNQIITISTIAAVVTASVALLMMNFSKNGKTVDESRAWLKRIIVTWAILNGLGFIMAYIVPFFQGGKWTG